MDDLRRKNIDEMGMPVRILSQWDQTIDTAESVGKELAYSYSLKDCDAEEALAFRAWLAGDTDEMPEAMPKSTYVAFIHCIFHILSHCSILYHTINIKHKTSRYSMPFVLHIISRCKIVFV